MFLFDVNWQIQQTLNQWWWLINIALLIILVALGWLSYKKPAYAVGLTIILLPTYLFRSKIFFLPLTFLELCIWVTFIGWLINRVKQKGLRVTGADQYRGPITLLLLAATISVFISPDQAAAAGLWKAYFVEPILFFIVVASVAAEKNGRTVMLGSLGLATLSISLLAIYQKFTGFGIAEPGWLAAEHRRVTAMFTSPNAVGLFLGPIVAMYIGWLLNELKNKKQILLKTAVIILAFLAIGFTVSQGTWLGLLAAGIFLAFFGWNKKWTTALVLLGIVVIMALPATRTTAWTLASFQDAAGQNRLALFHISQQYLTSGVGHFIGGAGLLGFAAIENQQRDPLRLEPLLYPHNIILNFWLETGLLGLIAMSWLLVLFFKTGLWHRDKNDWLTLGIMAAMVTVIVHGLVDVPYFKNDLAVLFWTVVGLLPTKILSSKS